MTTEAIKDQIKAIEAKGSATMQVHEQRAELRRREGFTTRAAKLAQHLSFLTAMVDEGDEEAQAVELNRLKGAWNDLRYYVSTGEEHPYNRVGKYHAFIVEEKDDPISPWHIICVMSNTNGDWPTNISCHSKELAQSICGSLNSALGHFTGERIRYILETRAWVGKEQDPEGINKAAEIAQVELDNLGLENASYIKAASTNEIAQAGQDVRDALALQSDEQPMAEEEEEEEEEEVEELRLRLPLDDKSSRGVTVIMSSVEGDIITTGKSMAHAERNIKSAQRGVPAVLIDSHGQDVGRALFVRDVEDNPNPQAHG